MKKLVIYILIFAIIVGVGVTVYNNKSQISQLSSAKISQDEKVTQETINVITQNAIDIAEAEAKAKAEAEAKAKAEAEAKAKAEAEAKAKAEAEAKAKAEAEAKAKAEAEAKAKAEEEAKAKAEAEAEAKAKAEEEARLKAEQEALAAQNANSLDATQARIQYIQQCNKYVSLENATRIVEICEEFASDRDYLDADMLLGIARLESTFRHATVSANEKYLGLMQVSKYYGGLAGYTEDQLLDPYYNVKYACEILDDLNNKLNGDTKGILQAYNMGYYGYKAKLDSGAELTYSFYNNVKKYADQIKAMYQ